MPSGDARLLGWIAGIMIAFAVMVAFMLPGMLIDCFRVSL